MLGANCDCVRCGASIYSNNEPMIVFYKDHVTAYDHPKHSGRGKSHTLNTNKSAPIFLTEGYDELPDGTR